MSATIERLIAARDGLKGLNISDYALIREAREAMAEAANALASVSAERDEAQYRERLCAASTNAERFRAETAEAEAASWKAEAATSFLALGEARALLEPLGHIAGEIAADMPDDMYFPAETWALKVGLFRKAARFLSKHGSKGE